MHTEADPERGAGGGGERGSGSVVHSVPLCSITISSSPNPQQGWWGARREASTGKRDLPAAAAATIAVSIQTWHLLLPQLAFRPAGETWQGKQHEAKTQPPLLFSDEPSILYNHLWLLEFPGVGTGSRGPAPYFSCPWMDQA